MNKEECLKALGKIENDEYLIAEDDEGDLIHIVNLYKNELKTLRYLIHEHFDNQPLKFEELEVRKVYWDKKYNQWCLIIMVCKYPHTKYFDGTISDAKFEEDRFYRKQVKE